MGGPLRLTRVITSSRSAPAARWLLARTCSSCKGSVTGPWKCRPSGATPVRVRFGCRRRAARSAPGASSERGHAVRAMLTDAPFHPARRKSTGLAAASSAPLPRHVKTEERIEDDAERSPAGGGPSRPVLAYALGGLGVVAAGAGGLLTYWGRLDNDRLAGCSPACAQSSVDHVHRLYIGADVALGVGAALMAGATWAYSRHRSQRSEASFDTALRVDVQPHGSRRGGRRARDVLMGRAPRPTWLSRRRRFALALGLAAPAAASGCLQQLTLSASSQAGGTGDSALVTSIVPHADPIALDPNDETKTTADPCEKTRQDKTEILFGLLRRVPCRRGCGRTSPLGLRHGRSEAGHGGVGAGRTARPTVRHPRRSGPFGALRADGGDRGHAAAGYGPEWSGSSATLRCGELDH